MAQKRSYRTFGVLDIGTSKVVAAVIIADIDAGSAQPSLRVAGLGLQRSKGVKAGVLTNLDEAESVVRSAIGQAERAAGAAVGNYTVSLACGRMSSTRCTARTEVETGYVTPDDLARLVSAGESYAERDARALIHLNRLGYDLDGASGVRDPLGLAGRQLSAGFHAVTADESPLRNLLLLLERCYAGCDGLVASPYASALAVTTEEERQFGVTCIDLGAGTTTIALFVDGMFVGVEVIPVGGQHITYDIAKSLQTPLAEAERIKTLYGTMITAQSDEHESFSHPITGEDDDVAYETTKARLTGVIRPRVLQLMGLVRERLARDAAVPFAGEKIVLTGGSSQLLGLPEAVADVLGRPVRLGRPADIAGLNASLSGPQMATLSGLAMIAARGAAEFSTPHDVKVVQQGYLGRVGTWLKRSF